MRFLHLAALVAGLSACIEPGLKEIADTGDTATLLTVPEPGDPAACPGWVAYNAVGDRWTYTESLVGVPITREFEITAYDTETGALRVASTFDMADGAIRTDSVIDYLCAEGGLYETQVSGTTVDLTSGYESTSVTVYDPPAFVLPQDLSVGLAWEATWEGTLEGTETTEGGGTEDIAEEVRAEIRRDVVAEEDVDTPLGTHTAMRVDQREEGTDDDSYWFADGVGLVQGEGYLWTSILTSR